MSRPSPSASLLGLGSMGASLARQLLKSGHKLTIWNRTAERPIVKELVAIGANYATSTTEAFRASRIVILCLLDYPTIWQLMSDINDSTCLEDKIMINLTNGTPKDAREIETNMISEWKTAAYFDGGIMATPPLIGTESAFIFVSGADEQRLINTSEGHSVQDILSCLGRVEYLGPEVDSAALYDAALLAGMYGIIGGAMTSIALLSKRKNKESPSISETVSKHLIPWLRAILPSLENTAALIEQDDTESHGHGNAMRCIAMQNVTRAAKEEGVDAGPLEYLLQTYEAAVKGGAGDQGVAVIGRKYWQQ